MRNVFKVYGITVDMHHLTLVASYMTAGGAYRPFSRYGMHDSTSPLQQMSYETATDFLKNAALQGSAHHLLRLDRMGAITDGYLRFFLFQAKRIT